MRIPVPVTDIDNPATLQARWSFWARIPAGHADALREREKALHKAYSAAKADRLRHSWLYGFDES
jgi:hypothetical protein